jgi:hypothetical protein
MKLRAAAPASIDRDQQWVAIERYGNRPAPGGLALVHDFLNTRANGQYQLDLIGDAVHAQAWATHAVHAWSTRRGTESEPPTLTEADTSKLRDLRDALDDMLGGLPAIADLRLSGTAELTPCGVDEISWSPTGTGCQWFYSALLTEVLLSQNKGTWRRLKQCRNRACRATFYDSSWDNASMWHKPGACDETPAHGTSPARGVVSTSRSPR